MKKASAFVLFVSALALSGCNISPMGFGEAVGGKTSGSTELAAGGTRVEESSPAFGGIEPTGTPKLIIQGEWDNGKALEKMYGTYNAEAKRSVWKPQKEELSKFNYYDSVTDLASRAIFSRQFKQGERERVFVVTKTAPARGACDDCVPVLGAAVFSKVDDEWKLDTQSKAITRTGQHGELSGGKLVKLGPNKYGALFNWKHTSLGVTEEGLLLLAETKTGLKEVFSMITGGNNKAYCQENGLYEDDPECWGYNSKVEFVPADDGGMYELQVVTNGTRAVDQGQVENVRLMRRLQYSDSGYRPLR
jgi:hypothetical protein